VERAPELPPPPSRDRTAHVVAAVAAAALSLAIVLSVFAHDPDVEARRDLAPGDAPVELTIDLVEGDVLTYDILLEHDAEYEFDTGEAYGGVYRNDARFTIDIADVGPNGAAGVEVTVPPVRLLEGVNDLPLGVRHPQLLRFGEEMAQDRLVELSADADGQSTVIGLLWPPLPPDAVRPGQTWPLSLELANGQGAGGVSYDGLCRFLGYEELQGLQTARITCRADVTIDMVIEADLVAASTGLSVEQTARDGTYTLSGTGYVWISAWIDLARDLVVRADTQMQVNVRTKREGFETPWYKVATEVGTIGHRIELAEIDGSDTALFATAGE